MFFALRQSRPRRAAGALFLACTALWLAGCAVFAPQTPEEAVTQRSQERWAAMIAGDFDHAWTYTQPGYRAVVRQRDYVKRFGSAGQPKAVQVNKAECEAERCALRVTLTSKILLPGFRGQEVTVGIDEIWVREDGQWWYYQIL
ncbi:MAG: hypothetical protein LBI48_06500 [Burkholderiaceae bacterium]|jgi:hypothetical protein|nr:hypothetical protein [Burkholderiaceae bacterium]